jgi:hypothetical protein
MKTLKLQKITAQQLKSLQTRFEKRGDKAMVARIERQLATVAKKS